MESQPTTPRDSIACSACGHLNPAWRSECEKCGAKLVLPGRPTYSSRADRPGCVTAYVILLGLGILAIGWGVMAVIRTPGYGRRIMAGGGVSLIVVAAVVAVLYILLARGLWLLRNWARIIVIVLHSLIVLSGMLSILGTIISFSGPLRPFGSPVPGICAALVVLAVGGTGVYWFASNGHYFD